jgi:TonB-linked SusC/RagA family outer membrane protein
MTVNFKQMMLKTKDWAGDVKSLVSCLMLLLAGWSISAQTVSGTVSSDKDGTPLIGASVLEKGTGNGTITDIDGNFSLKLTKVPAVLEVSYIGYGTMTYDVAGAQSGMAISLSEGTALSEVVVTALGISREKKGLTYALDEIKGTDLTTFKDANVVNSLQGRSAGLFIGRSGSGIGGSTRVVLRGNKSTTNNSPLYVIDGVPMNNTNGGEQGGIFGGGIDAGDGISNINPEDIESMSVLKGASAAALYGSGAVNGVILVTTKKGKSGKPKINISSSYVSESPFGIPDLQYSYGQTAPGDVFSWGKKGNFNDHVTGFFQNGSNFINSVSVSGGSDVAQSYFSYSNTNAKGIVPNNSLGRHNFNFNQTASFFENKLNLKASVNFINQNVDNRPAAGLYFNPLTGLYFLPRGLDFDKFTTDYEVYNKDRNFNLQNWHADSDIQQNPHWIVNRNLNNNVRNRVISGLTTSYAFNDWLSLQLRGNVDKSFDNFEQKIYASTQATLSHRNGRYAVNKSNTSLIYGDAILSLNKNISDKLTFDANLGMAHNHSQTNFIRFDSGTEAGLNFANEFYLQNIKAPNLANMSEGTSRVKTNSIFGSTRFGYENFLYLDITGRNDWTSSLPNTSFFYPSFGLSSILTEKMDLGPISFAKLRASYAIVGSGVPAYLNNPISERHQIVNGQLVLTTVGVIPGTELKPEESKSLEIGVDLRALNNKLSVDLTYYKNNTINQFIQVSAPVGSGFTRYLVNAGDIQNSGIEGLIGYQVIDNRDFKWHTSLNFTRNVNEVLAVEESFDKNDVPFYINEEGVNSYRMALKKGGQFGDIYGVVFDRDAQGRIKLDDKGVPTKKDGFEYLGNANPNFMAGWNNEFTIKGFNIRFLIDGRFGGKVMSLSESMLDLFGVSQATADARDAGGVEINAVSFDGKAVSKIDAEKYYTAVGGRNGITEAYMYDATNIRLRELSLGYQLPKSLVSGKNLFKAIRISLIGRNLFFLSKKAPFDPDLTFSTGVGLQGVDVFALPTTRSLGASVSFDF